MKHIFSSRLLPIVFAFVVAALLSGCAVFRFSDRAEESPADGEAFERRYEIREGAAPGHRGMIRLRIAFENGSITEITVIESREDRTVGGAAMEELTDMILIYGTTEIDAISGATQTSKGFLKAVENAIMNL